MKARNEIIALAILIMMCLAFAACAQKVEDKLTDKATDPSMISTTLNEDESESSKKTTKANSTTKKDNSTSKVEDETSAELDNPDEMSVTADEAKELLDEFYGSLYKVEAKGKKNGKQFFVVKDNNGKEYAQVTVDLKTSDVTEKITGTGEVSHWNLLV